MKATISVFGLGRVGTTLAAALLEAGHEVVGVDVHPDVVRSLDEGSFRTNEPGVNDILRSTAPGRLRATMDPAVAVAESDISFVLVPTHSNSLGGFSNKCVLEALRTIGGAARTKAGRHTVALVSTVLPGSSETQLMPFLASEAAKDIGYCYNPSFIAQGEIMRGLVEPDYVLIGESDAESGDMIQAVHESIVQNKAPAVRQTPTEAEITKIASNTHETMRVAFANMLGALCNEIPGTDVDRITGALAHRLGGRFFRAATPYGGPCWPRDNRALAGLMEILHVPTDLPDAIDRANDEHGKYVLAQILAQAPRGSTVSVLGLAYKPASDILDESFGFHIATKLLNDQRVVMGWDPLVSREALRGADPRIELARDASECLDADVIVIALPLHELSELNWEAASKATVIDCWRTLDVRQQEKVATYVALGRRPRSSGDTPTLTPDWFLLAD